MPLPCQVYRRVEGAGSCWAEAFSATLGTSHKPPRAFPDSRRRAGKVLGISPPARLPGEEIRFGEGEAGAQALTKQNHGASHQAKDFNSKLCPEF